MKNKIASIALPLIFGLMFLLIWESGFLHTLLNLKKFQLPIPSEILETTFLNISKTLYDCMVTISGALIGMAIGSAFGFMIAVIATIFPKWGYGGMMLITAFNAIPIVALSPIMNCWFTTGMEQKIGVVTVVCMAAMAMNAYSGMNNLKPFSLDLLHSAAANKWIIFKKLRLPNCLPNIFTALKINISAAIIAAIISEYFTASTSGLGFGIKDNLRKSEMAMGWSYILVASIAGILLFGIVALIEKDAIKWHASQRKNAVR